MYHFLKINYIVKSLKECELKLNEKYTKLVGKAMFTCVVFKVRKIAVEKLGVSRQELLTRKNNPMVTFKHGSVSFNIHAVRMLECEHINILIHHEKKTMIARPCANDDRNALQWRRLDKQGKVAPKTLSGKFFTSMLYYGMNWVFEDTVKIPGEFFECNNEKILVFKLNE